MCDWLSLAAGAVMIDPEDKIRALVRSWVPDVDQSEVDILVQLLVRDGSIYSASEVRSTVAAFLRDKLQVGRRFAMSDGMEKWRKGEGSELSMSSYLGSCP